MAEAHNKKPVDLKLQIYGFYFIHRARARARMSFSLVGMKNQ